MQLSAQKVRYENLRSLGFSSISGSYAGVGTSFANPVRMLKITNLTDANLIISFDAISDKDIIAAKTSQIYDYCSNMATQSGNMEQPVGDRVYVKQESTAATLGNVYVTLIYAATT